MMALHIITVTQGGVLYRDRHGIVRWIDFVRCNKNWLASRPHVTPADQRCVGQRNTGDVLDVVFATTPPVRFVFISYAQRDATLLNPMRRFGWCTWDVSRG